MKPEKLTMMANQIGAFFKGQSETEAPAAIADHLKKFWDPGMRKDIVAHLDAGGAGLDPLVKRAVELVRAKS
ncbi:MAG: formate dehydrogenase subunit delta [Alphaproteobacteria bacterium]|jgi:formate dehydrogenase subunit delta|nr:formate dehydrogenase subunit delta [Alphaproteobacteria bacterium]